MPYPIMFCDIQAASVPGSKRSESKLTEDALYASQSVLIVMDGATVVNGDANHFLDNASDAHWLSHRGCSILGLRLEEVSSSGGGEQQIEDAIFETLCALEREYVDVTCREVSMMTPADVPSSTLSFAVISDGKLIVGQLGDSPLSVKMRDGESLYMAGDEVLMSLDEANKEAMARLVDEGYDIASAHSAMMPQFSAMRERHCNNGEEDAYRIFCFVGKEHAAPKMATIDACDAESIVICSDGYADMFLFEPELTFGTLHDETIASVRDTLGRLVAYQDDDADCRKFMRFKRSDDITVVAAMVG